MGGDKGGTMGVIMGEEGGTIKEISHLLVFRVNLQAQAAKLVASWVSGTHSLSTHSSMEFMCEQLYKNCKHMCASLMQWQ